MKHNKIFAAALTAAITAAPISAMPISAAADEQISVYVDGVQIEFDVAPISENDRTLVPMRAIFEALGAEVAWDDDTQTAAAARGDDTVSITIDSNILYINGEAIELDVPARMIDDRTLVPVRAISESFGAVVEWDEETQTVTITSPSASGDMLAIGELSEESIQKLQESADEIRSDFEQNYLPKAIYEAAANGNLYDYMSDSAIVDYVTDVWYKCVLAKIGEIENESNDLYSSFDITTGEDMLDEYYDLIEETGIEIPIMGIAVIDDDMGMRISVVVFYEADTEYECKFIGIVADSDGGASYFTAENDPDDVLNWYICEQYEDGQFTVSAVTAKSGDEETDMNTFIQLVSDAYLAETSSGE